MGRVRQKLVIHDCDEDYEKCTKTYCSRMYWCYLKWLNKKKEKENVEDKRDIL